MLLNIYIVGISRTFLPAEKSGFGAGEIMDDDSSTRTSEYTTVGANQKKERSIWERESSYSWLVSTLSNYTMRADKRKKHPNGSQLSTKSGTKIKCALLGGVCAGKTSILRRYFNGSIPSPGSHRNPTLGSDFFSRRIKCSVDDHSDEVIVSLTIWDTPGRENRASRRSKYRAAFSDSFFRSLDAIILVYDVSSSTSFTHVLQWHADLTERMKRLVDSGTRDRALPILVAANKMDIMKRRGTEQSRPQNTKNKRDVIGLRGKDFRGKDSRYEYTVGQTPTIRNISSASGESMAHSKGHRHRFELSTYMGTGDQISYLEQFFNNEVRGSYIESLLSTEDGSHPDMEMVLLWCHRNQLIHHSVSALDGKYFRKIRIKVLITTYSQFLLSLNTRDWDR